MVLYALVLPYFDNNIWGFNCITPITLNFLAILLFIIFTVLVLVHGLVHYILIITLVLIVLFSQIIPCRARCDFLEHVGAPIVTISHLWSHWPRWRCPLEASEFNAPMRQGEHTSVAPGGHILLVATRCNLARSAHFISIITLTRYTSSIGPLMTLEMTSSLVWSCCLCM